MADPVMLRVYNDGHKGATAFFRNRPFLDVLFSALLSVTAGPLKIMVHASSIGAEPYSIALWWLHKVLPLRPGCPALEIVATDIDAGFLGFAQRGNYPADIMAGMTREERSWFVSSGDTVRIPDAVRRMVRFHAPMNFVTDAPGEKFDAVLIMNALTYVSVSEQSSALRRCSGYSRHLLGLTAFHPDSIRADIEGIGFEPCMRRHRDIHDAWGDRLAPAPVPAGGSDYSWRLPPYETDTADFAFRYGAIFQRRLQAGSVAANIDARQEAGT